MLNLLVSNVGNKLKMLKHYVGQTRMYLSEKFSSEAQSNLRSLLSVGAYAVFHHVPSITFTTAFLLPVF